MKRFYIFLIFLISTSFSLKMFAYTVVVNGKPWYEEFYSNRISDDSKNLWIATSQGIIKYNKSTGDACNVASEVGGTLESTYTAVEVNSDGVVCYSEDKNYEMSKVWDGESLIEYGSFSCWGSAYSFAINSKGDVWASLLGRYFPPLDSADHNIGYGTSNMVSSSVQTAIMDMAFDSNDRLWIAMYGDYDYLGYHNNSTTNSTVYVGENPTGVSEKMITSIAIDNDNNIWFASEDGINCYYQATGEEVCMTKEQYPAMLENRYYGNDIDDNGNIWFTSENNLLKWDGTQFTTYTCPVYQEARSMLCDGDIVWVLLKNDTLLKFKNNEFEAIDLTPAITKDATIPRGIELDKNAFGIPVDQLGFDTSSTFTLSFWVNPKLFNHSIFVNKGGTNFLSIRDISQGWPNSDYGYVWSQIGNTSEQNFGNRIIIDTRIGMSGGATSIELSPIQFNALEWKHFSFVFDVEDNHRKILLYVDGVPSYKINDIDITQTSWSENNIIMIGGARYNLAPMEAYLDKVQLYAKALTQTEVKESMKVPLLSDPSLLGYWNFEFGNTIDEEGYMLSDNGSIKAAMYKILSLGGVSSEIDIIPFAYGKGVMDDKKENTLQSVEQSFSEKEQTKAYLSNKMLYIENAEGVNSIVVYDTMGRVITSTNANGVSSVQIALPSTIKGVIIVKVDSDIVKLILD
ncbi:MAG: hypothetical protein IKV14_00615 [Muribaculaceae bacterium]|nr:hypothetical protein [Muribaculaceae bacterium]